jgi:hypothetical protein
VFDNILIREDILVILVAVLLYLSDIARLLYSNEILLVHGTRSDWSAITPSDGVRVARRRLVLPSILDPGSVVIRFQWPLDELRCTKTNVTGSAVNERLRLLLFPKLVCLLLLPEIFVGLPVAYYLFRDNWILLSFLAIIYGQIITLVIWLFLSRHEFSLTWRSCFILAFESLICIPYAINFHRKVAEKTMNLVDADLLVTAECLLGTTEFNDLRTYIRDILDDRLTGHQADAKSSNKLVRLRARLEQISDNEP